MLQTLAAHDWKPADDDRRQALALALLDCLADPDPALRDELAFAAISHWARARALRPATLDAMRATLVARLKAPPEADDRGFARPFAALALAEVARADRLAPFLTTDERSELVRVGTAYLTSVRDYRGFDERDGWRHGVAHGADLLLQLSVHPAIQRGELDAILAAIASQVMPADHFYIFGEGDRLMAPVFYIGRRDALTGDEWTAWFAVVARRAADAPKATLMSLAARHDLAAFLLPLYVSVQESGTAEMRARMLPGVTAALKVARLKPSRRRRSGQRDRAAVCSMRIIR